MPNLLPVQLKEMLERVNEKAGRLLDKLKSVKKSDTTRERITEDLLPVFTQFGGPPLDMRESADELIITVEVPGLKRDDFSIELVGRRLVIRGEKRISRERTVPGESYLSECSYGRFERSVQLPYGVADNKIKAELKSGVLTIRMPRPESERKRQHRVLIS